MSDANEGGARTLGGGAHSSNSFRRKAEGLGPSVYVDLDRTLFQTSRTEEIWQAVEQLYPAIDANEQSARATEFHTDTPYGYCYDFFAQLKSLGIDSNDARRRLLTLPLADGRLQFDGEAELVAWLNERADVTILSFGKRDYQSFKQALCPALDGIPLETVMGSKGEWLADKGECWLIDDKPQTDLPPNVRFIQVSLEGKEVVSQPWLVLTSLADVKEYLSHNIDKP